MPICRKNFYQKPNVKNHWHLARLHVAESFRFAKLAKFSQARVCTIAIQLVKVTKCIKLYSSNPTYHHVSSPVY